MGLGAISSSFSVFHHMDSDGTLRRDICYLYFRHSVIREGHYGLSGPMTETIISIDILNHTQLYAPIDSASHDALKGDTGYGKYDRGGR